MQVRIGPSFFSNEFKEYANWQQAFIREFVQNGMDARGAGRIECTIKLLESGDTLVVFFNDGMPMDRHILVNKLLSLGESGKRFENGAVGGFGKAKNLLYFCHRSYTIKTGEFLVTGCGGEFDLVEGQSNRYGTESSVVVAGDHVEKFVESFKWFVALGQWSGQFVLNGETMKASLAKGSPRRELEFGTVYTNKSYSNKMVVRINGIPMFSQWVELDRCVIVELNGKSSDVLTANRDGLRSPYNSQLSSFVQELAVDKRSALKTKRVSKYQVFRGQKLRSQVEKQVTLTSILGYTTGRDDDDTSPLVTMAIQAEAKTNKTQDWTREIESTEPKSSLTNFFVLKNETELFIPNCYNPNTSEFSQYSRRLAGYWAKLMLQCHTLFKCEGEFGIGFIFDDESEAERERTSEFGVIYYINPVEVRKQKNSTSRSFAKRFALTERDRLISLAVHEMCHEWCRGHDENFANKITDMFAMAMKERSSFNWCFK